jgi:hypothetical protein
VRALGPYWPAPTDLSTATLRKEIRRGFRQPGVDEHPRAQLEPRHPCQPWDHADIPMEMPRAAIFRWPAPHREVQVRILQSDVNLGEQRGQNPRQIDNLKITRCRRSSPYGAKEECAWQTAWLRQIPPWPQNAHPAERFGSSLPLRAPPCGKTSTRPHRRSGGGASCNRCRTWLGITAVAISRECGRCRLAPASAP